MQGNLNNQTAYGKLCSLFYDATKQYATKKEVDFYANFINQRPGRVLEAMSGSGRLQIPLMQRGYVVDGVDNSKAMLERCKERCAQLHLEPELYEQSLELFSSPYTYATVTIAVGSFQLLSTYAVALAALKNIHAHMQKGGNLLIDLFIPDVASENWTKRVVRIDSATVIRATTRYVVHEDARLVDAFCLYTLMVNGMVEKQENEYMQITWYTDESITQLLNEAGFEVVCFYDETLRSTGPSRIVCAQAR